MAEQAVRSEPLSAGNFPVMQGRFREYLRSEPKSGEVAGQKPSWISCLATEFPTRRNREFLRGHQGNKSTEQGIKSAKQGMPSSDLLRDRAPGRGQAGSPPRVVPPSTVTARFGVGIDMMVVACDRPTTSNQPRVERLARFQCGLQTTLSCRRVNRRRTDPHPRLFPP